MSRRKPAEEHSSHERWLVSYADFITLMFAFFVVMYATSQADKNKAHQLSASVASALQDGKLSAAIAEILGKQKGVAGKPAKAVAPQSAVKMAELTPSLKALTAELKNYIDAGKIKVNLEARGLVISLKEAAFFPSADDQIKPEGLPIIERLAETIRKVPNPVRLEGHTDSQPIANQRFSSNWDLSAARSIAMLKLLNERYGIPADRLAAVAYADTVPMGDNATEEGRILNRRVEVAILSDEAARSQSQPAAARNR